MEILVTDEQAVYSNKVRTKLLEGRKKFFPFLLQICGPAGRIPRELHRLLKLDCPYIKPLELLVYYQSHPVGLVSWPLP